VDESASLYVMKLGFVTVTTTPGLHKYWKFQILRESTLNISEVKLEVVRQYLASSRRVY
jgi:hypothetical protein